MLLSSSHGHHASTPFDQMHGFDAGASSSTSGHYTPNGRARGHAHSMSSDGLRPRSASSIGASSSSSSTSASASASASTSRLGSPAARASLQGTSSTNISDATLTDEQRLHLLRQQQAQRRPKMLRLTPAINQLGSSSRSMSASVTPQMAPSAPQVMDSSRPASIVGITSLIGAAASVAGSSSSSGSASESEPPPNAGLTIVIDPKMNGLQASNHHDADSKIMFPMVGSPPNQHAMPLHPGSRKALAQKAGLLPADGANLQLDLGCISGPSVSDSSAASANSAMTLPDLVRKKSGEPVKSSLKHFSQSAFLHRSDSSPAAPASFRAKSVPNTPTVAKAVHFDPILEHIKVFKHRQRPTAVSRDGSPEHTETETEEEREFPFYQNWRRHAASLSSPSGSGSQGSAASTPTGEATTEQLVLRLPNFPSSAKLSVDREIFLERVFLSDDLRSVKGTVQVQNLAFEKWVAVRFTLDNWATVCEVSAEYSESIKGGKSDRFTFSIKLNELLIWSRGQQETKTMFLCLRFNAAGKEFWDNNTGDNYQLDFRKRPVSQPDTPGQSSRSRSDSAASMMRAATVAAPRKANSPGLGSGEFAPRRNNPHKTFQVEEFSRSLEKLRAQDDDCEESEPVALRSTKARRRSPPVSPGSANGRSSSPSMWTARYDFSESLKNPKTGSRTTNAGRQAALDYFSARPPPPSTALQRSVFIGPASNGQHTVSLTRVDGDVFSPTESVESTTPGATQSATIIPAASKERGLTVPVGIFTTKAGMISPGLGDVMAAHFPTTLAAVDSATPSPSTGLNSPVPELSVTPALEVAAAVPVQTEAKSPSLAPVTPQSSEPRNAMSTKYFSYPVNRSTLSPAGQMYRSSRGPEERAPSPLSRPVITAWMPVSAPTGHESPVKKDRANGVLFTSGFVGESPPQSPVSPLHSPNPFSPSLSVSSLESDTTTCLASPEDTTLNGNSTLGSRRSTELRAPSSIEDIHRSLLHMARGEPGAGPVLPASDGPPSNYSHSQSGSVSPTLSAISDSSSSAGSMKPGSVSSYDELIARFCWHDSSAESSGTVGAPAGAVGGTTPTNLSPSPAPNGSAVALVGPRPADSSATNGAGVLPGMHMQHAGHRMFASSMGSPSTESGSTTPTIGF